MRVNTAAQLTCRHTESPATRAVDKWTFGPVTYRVGQVSDIRSSAFYEGAVNLNRHYLLAVGAERGCNFGPAQLTVWALGEVTANGPAPRRNCRPDR
jgi:hypothetical protein